MTNQPLGGAGPAVRAAEPPTFPGLVDGTLTVGVDPDGCYSFQVSITCHPSSGRASHGHLELLLRPEHAAALLESLRRQPSPGRERPDGFDEPVPCCVGIRLDPYPDGAIG